MQRLFIPLLCMFLSLQMSAQEKYTEVIQKEVPGQGKLTLHQSQQITDMVNGSFTAPVSPSAKKVKQVSDTLSNDTAQTVLTGKKVRSTGYRIQVYSGDNSRRGKSEAYAYGSRVKGSFDRLPVYISFISPHWVCRVGDFQTYDEASEYFRQMKAMGGFSEAVIVRSKISVRY